MELVKFIHKNNQQKNIYKRLNFIFYKQNENSRSIDYKLKNNNNSLQLTNIQSFSTGIDDIKDNEIKETLSQKNINIVNIFKKNKQNTFFDFINDDSIKIKSKKEFYSIKKPLGNGGFGNVFLGYDNVNKRFMNLSSKNINSIQNYTKKNKFKNRTISNLSSNKNDINNIILIYEDDSKLQKDVNNKNINNNTKCVNNYNLESNQMSNKNDKYINNKIFKEDNNDKSENNKNNISQKKNVTLKPFPPKIPQLFHSKYEYELSCDQNYNFKISKYYCKPKIPNVFYNHIFIKNKNIANKNSLLSISITSRNKGKTLTILYYRPNKNI